MPIPRLLQHVFDVLSFMLIGFLPIYFMRNMYTTVCGRQFTMSVIYEYIAPFAMIFAAIQMQVDSTLTIDVLHESMKIVGILAGVSATLAYICVTWFMERKYKYLWWSTRNPAQHFSEYIWDSGIYEDLGFELDDHRAQAIAYIFIPKYYLPDARVEAWVHEKWNEWEAEPPLWFNSDFKRSLPQRLLPRHARYTSSSLMDKLKTMVVRVCTFGSARSVKVVPGASNDDDGERVF